MTAIADQSDTTMWPAWFWLLILLMIGCVWFTFMLARAAGRPRPRPQNAAPAQTNPAPAPGRAPHHHYDPALRVHLCVGGCKAIVRNPGDICLSCFGAPAHRAEEITRQAWRGGAAS